MEHQIKKWYRSRAVFGWRVSLGLYGDPDGVGAATKPQYCMIVRLVREAR